MNIILFTQDEPIYMPHYIEPIIAEHNDKISEIIFAPPNNKFLTKLKERYDMLGPKNFTLFGLLYLKLKFLDKCSKFLAEGTDKRYYSVRSIADNYGVDYRKIHDVNRSRFVSSIQNKSPDLILSIACGQRIEEDLLRVPCHGCINIHGSLLPKYRGLATSFWVLYNDENKNGVTAHYMLPEFDAGDIILQREYDINEDDSMHDVYMKLIDNGSELTIDLIYKIQNDEINPRPNPINEGSYYTLPGKSERKEFLRNGNKFI